MRKFKPVLSAPIGKFGRLTPISLFRVEDYRPTLVRNRWEWRILCVCNCGKIKDFNRYVLEKGIVLSCGCIKRDFPAQLFHGHTRRGKHTPEWRTWAHMKSRCSDPDSYLHSWGHRISFCKRWESFENFLVDMGPRPEGKSLDRFPNPDGNYEPKNCRWATPKEQSNNRRLRRK